MVTKAERFLEFMLRMSAADPCQSLSEAFALLCVTLNAVEDELTSIPSNPITWASDGRMYPPQEDQKRVEVEDPLVVKYRNRRHSTWVGENGSIRITAGDLICLDKPGHDGRSLDALMDSTLLNRSSKP